MRYSHGCVYRHAWACSARVARTCPLPCDIRAYLAQSRSAAFKRGLPYTMPPRTVSLPYAWKRPKRLGPRTKRRQDVRISQDYAPMHVHAPTTPSLGGIRTVRGHTDRRYGTARWRKVRLSVLRRDRFACWFLDCPKTADVADHVDRVTPETTDGQFYNPVRIRASCRRHNLQRTLVAIFDEAPADEPRRSPLGSRSPFRQTRTFPWSATSSSFATATLRRRTVA